MAGGDKLFEQYLAARVPAEDPDCLLESLLAAAQPVVNRVVRSRLGSLYTPADAAELSSEAMLELLSRLRSLYDEGLPPANLRFEALAAGVAANTVHRFYARRFPERNRLRKKIRYVVETGERFSLWLGPDGSTVCGLAGAAPQDSLATATDVDRCLERLRDKPVPAHPPALLVFEVLKNLKRPIELTRLTTIAADFVGLREPAWISPADESGEEGGPFLTDPLPSAATRLEFRERVETLWPEILLLPPRQRVALLLSARIPSGSAAWLLVDLSVASFREMAAALEMTAEELAEVWNLLPLEDRQIAQRLGLERQQVINLRATARERLTRREIRAARPRVVPIEGPNRS